MAHLTRIMYIENKGGLTQPNPWGEGTIHAVQATLSGPARIGRVMFSKTRRSLSYQGKHFHKAEGFKSNFICEETAEAFWISGPKKRGGDALYATNIPTAIDEDVREEYWTVIREQPERVKETKTL
jgi:hypothetical protein